MQNKKVILGVAAGVAVLAVAGIIVAKKRKAKSYDAKVEEAKENFKKKLDKLHAKASKHYKSSRSETLDAVNEAKERANQWVNRANA